MPPNPDLDHDLIKRYIDGTLDDVGFAELQNRLRTNQETRELLRTWTRMEMGLREASLTANEKLETVSAAKSHQEKPNKWRIILLFAALLVAVAGIVLLTRQKPVITQELSAQYVATIIRSQSVIWEKVDYNDGQRLYPGPLAIRSGSVHINCDQGASLDIEGPATIEVTSSTSAQLTRGAMTLRNASHTEPFQIITPHSYLDDVGADYSISLTEHGETVTVYAGELWRTDKLNRDKVTIIKQGQAWRVNNGAEALSAITSSANTGLLVETKRAVKLPFAWQSFRGISEKDLISPASNDGLSKSGGWWKNGWEINRHTDVIPGETTIEYIAQGVNVTGDASFYNQLKTPIRLNENQQLFIAIRFNPSSDENYSLVLVLRGTGIMRQAVIVKNSKLLMIESEEKRTLKPISSLAGEEAVLLVKIASAKNQPDQLIVCAYKLSELPQSEPSQWHHYGSLFSQDEQIDKVACRCMSKLVMGLSDIRIGDSWASVTQP
jgi:hypothetical protein